GMCATVVGTLLIAGLLAGGFDGRGERFWMSLIAIVIAEVVNFGFLILMGSGNDRHRKVWPFQMAAIPVLLVYNVGVLCACLAAAVPALDIAWVKAIHVLDFLVLVLGLLVFSIGSRVVTADEEFDHSVGQKFQLIAEQARRVRLLAESNPGQGGVNEEIIEFCRGFDFATGESLPGSETVDGMLLDVLRSLGGALGTPQPDDRVTRELLGHARAAFQEREHAIATLRSL
ncbi:hypothetical protein OAL71_03360, partial [Phycisphaerales bacterium]|nr:hypothetical protein [Phycisphaerales bacterium]